MLTLQFPMAKSLQLVLIYLDRATNSHTSEEYKKLSNRWQRKSSLFSAQVHIFQDFLAGRGCTDCCTDLQHSAYRGVEAVCRQPRITTSRSFAQPQHRSPPLPGGHSSPQGPTRVRRWWPGSRSSLDETGFRNSKRDHRQPSLV